MKNVRISPYSVPLAVLALSEIIFFYSKAFYFILPAASAIILLAVFWQVRQSNSDEKWWNFALFPLIFTLCCQGLSVILSGWVLVQLIYALCSLVLYFYFKNIYFYLFKPSRYKSFSIENISSYGSFLAFFFLSLLAFGLQSILDAPVWILTLMILISSMLIIYEVLWANKVDPADRLIFSSVLGLLLSELFLSISFLSLKYTVAGMVLAISYYMLTGMARNQLIGKLDKGTARLYLVLGGASALIILITARWI